MTSKWRHTLKFLMNLNSRPKNSPMCQIWTWSSNYLENNSSFFVFSTQKMTWHNGNKRLLWQHLTTMVIAKIRKMSIKGVKLKSESFFSISPGVLELWTKNLRGGGFPPGPDRVNCFYPGEPMRKSWWIRFIPPPPQKCQPTKRSSFSLPG